MTNFPDVKNEDDCQESCTKVDLCAAADWNAGSADCWHFDKDPTSDYFGNYEIPQAKCHIKRSMISGSITFSELVDIFELNIEYLKLNVDGVEGITDFDLNSVDITYKVHIGACRRISDKGTDVKLMTNFPDVKSEDDCQESCTKVDTCAAADWNAGSSDCWHFDEDPTSGYFGNDEIPQATCHIKNIIKSGYIWPEVRRVFTKYDKYGDPN